MPGLLLHTGAAITCLHKGTLQIPPVQVRVRVSGRPVTVATAQIQVDACVSEPGNPPPPPCQKVKWTHPATRVRASCQPVLLQTAPTGTGDGRTDHARTTATAVISMQHRVRGL